MSISMCLWNCPNGMAALNRDGIATILMKGDAEAVRMFPSVSEKVKGQDGAQKTMFVFERR